MASFLQFGARVACIGGLNCVLYIYPVTFRVASSGNVRNYCAFSQQRFVTALTMVRSSRKSSDARRAIEALYRQTLPSSRTGPLYNAFSYPTKISPEAIAVFIATHTAPGAAVADTFAGSGTTGLAALLCDRPTQAMKQLAVEIGVEPQWGPRTAELFEVGTLGAFVSRTLCAPPEPNRFAEAVDRLRDEAQRQIGWVYEAVDAAGQKGHVRHVIWSEILVCPNCAAECTYWQAAVRRAPLSLGQSFTCRSCGRKNKVDACERAVETVPDDFDQVIRRRKRIPVRVYGTTGAAKWVRDPAPADLTLIDKIANERLPKSAPNEQLVWGDLYRAGYHTGIEKLHHLYTRRNFLVLSTLWHLIESADHDVRDALRLLVLSYNSAHSTLMTRVVVKSGLSDFVLTGAQSGVLYISGLPVEKNIILGIARKAKSFVEAFRLVYGSRSMVNVHNTSSTMIPLRDRSIDYVFTDPPFGAYIPYAEINQVNEIWLGKTTDRTKEIIVSQSQGKDVDAYGRMMGAVFSEMARVLKPGGLATVVFHSAHSAVWRALTAAYAGAGLSVRATSVLDKIQVSFKQVVSDVSVKGDPLLLLSKEPPTRRKKADAVALADEIVAGAAALSPDERDPQRLYSRFVGRCLELGIDVGLDAREFYGRAREALGASA